MALTLKTPYLAEFSVAVTFALALAEGISLNNYWRSALRVLQLASFGSTNVIQANAILFAQRSYVKAEKWHRQSCAIYVFGLLSMP